MVWIFVRHSSDLVRLRTFEIKSELELHSIFDVSSSNLNSVVKSPLDDF